MTAKPVTTLRAMQCGMFFDVAKGVWSAQGGCLKTAARRMSSLPFERKIATSKG